MTSNPRFRAVRLGLALLLGSTPSCEYERQLGDDGTASSGDGDTGLPPDLEDVPAAMAVARCASYFACDCGAIAAALAWDTRAECEDVLTSAFEAGFQASVDAGLTYDPAHVEEYLSFYERHGCDPADAESERSYGQILREGLFHGERGEGEACDGLSVILPGGTDCAPGLYCNGSTCRAPKADADACDGLDLPNQCDFDSFCDSSTSPPTCRPRPALGEPCGADLPCSEPAYVCRDGLCELVPVAGESCAELPLCAFAVCDPASSTCTAVPAACTPWFPPM